MMQQPAARAALSQQQLEQLLRATLVPVEPSPLFPHRLRARLVTLRQHGPSKWTLVAAAGTILVLIGATFAVGLRILLFAAGIVALLITQRDRRA